MKDNKKSKEDAEDLTKYGEFISSLFGWHTLYGQKKRAKQLENKTKKQKPM